MANVTEESLSILAVERWQSGDHLVEEGAETPPIDLVAVMVLILEDFGREVLSRANEARRLLTPRHVLLRESKVCQDGVALGIDHNVFRLEISIYDSIFMEVLEGEEDVCSVKLGIFHFESLTLTNVEVEFAALAII